jgi:hypothetical protein
VTTTPPEPRTLPDTLRECYGNLTALRAAVQLIPLAGGAIDTLIQGRTTQIQMARAEDVMRKLGAQMAGVERSLVDLKSEGFADLISSGLVRGSQARSELKRQRFANLLAHQICQGRPWDEAEAAMRLLAELEDIHVSIISVAVAAPPMGGPFGEIRGVSPVPRTEKHQSHEGVGPRYLLEVLPLEEPRLVRLAAIDLVAKGLLYDEGVGRWDGRPLTYLSPTDLAGWLLEWINNTSGARTRE